MRRTASIRPKGGLGFAPHQLTISAARHCTSLAYQPPDPRAQRIGYVIPVARHPLAAEQDRTDLALARTLADCIMDTQHIDAPIDPDIAGKERAGEAAMATQIEQSAERQQAGLR